MKHKAKITNNGVYIEVKLKIPRQLYYKLKFYQSKTHRPIEDLILEIIRGCIDRDP
jgi:hypothetical protein